MDYLIREDVELNDVRRNFPQIPLFVSSLVYNTGGFDDMKPEQIIDIHEKFTSFLNTNNTASIFVLFIKMTLNEHWIALVMHTPDPTIFSQVKLSKYKKGISLTKIYLVDSSNLVFLNKKQE
jgi:hypothetical protein